MITTDLVKIVACPSGYVMAARLTLDEASDWIAKHGARGRAVYEITPFRVCECCGAQASFWIHGANYRCRKHVGRNPCIVEGCTRTGAVGGGGYGTDHLICGRHWREHVPVGSVHRRIYNRFFRRAKKFGWTDNSCAAFDRFWRCLVSHVRARARGDVDMREINRIMGWENGNETVPLPHSRQDLPERRRRSPD